MRIYLSFIIFLSSLSLSVGAGEIAGINSPLKKTYKLDRLISKEFYQTEENVDSFSMICEMGQAVPDQKTESRYVNKPIDGLKLELRARAAFIDILGQVRPMGFVVVTKNGDVLIKFKPLGDFKAGKWDGDVFNSWSGAGTDIEVYSERFGKSGYAHFDLLDGNGFYYKNRRSSPDYFLSRCKRIKKENLPVYDWR